MKFKFGQNVLLALLLLFLELIKRCCPFIIEIVDPLVIKINTENLVTIPIIVLLNNTIDDDRANQKIRLVKVSTTSPFSKEIYAIEEEKQDQNNKRKIEFAFNQGDFVGQYGKYLLNYGDGYASYFSKTILIYANDIILKNPKKKYFLTGEGIIEAKYDISSIFKDEINYIRYYEASTPNIQYNLSKSDYSIEGNDNNMKLVLKFSKTNKPSSYIFDIFPEYDKETSNSEIQRFYLYFQDYLLNNDAIYINKNNYTNEVPFNLTFRYTFDSNLLSITGYTFRSSHLNNNNYEININLGRKYSPGKVNILYNGQERELFYILYDSNFLRCYEKEEIKDLIITMEWIDEMEYDHILYFNDTTSKLLTSSYVGKSGSTLIYKYKYSTLSLNSGVFSLKSTIPPLNYSSSYNPVDNNHLYFFIYPDSQAFDKKDSIIYSHNNSKQFIYINSSEPNGTTVLDEIILKKIDNSSEILISKTKGNCFNDNNNFYCDLKDIIINYDNDKNGNYSIIYKNKCDKNVTILGKVVVIKRGIGLSDIFPRWIDKSKVNKTNLILTYDDDLSDRNFKICFTKENKKDSQCIAYPIDSKLIVGQKGKVNVTLKNMEEGIYYVQTNLSDGVSFIQEDKNFKVSDPLKFKFNHHYFVKNNDLENKLIIRLIDTSDIKNKFGCRIVETIDNKTLNNGSNNCTIFDYPIIKEGTIRFNYSDKDGFLIPINDSIVVVSNHSKLFLLNEKFCYYYLFDISIDIMSSLKNKLTIKVFLKGLNNNIFLLNNSENENKYTYKYINSSFTNNEGFDLYISEEEKDDKVYLYKSSQKVKFTQLETQEYIVDPNKTIVFFNVYCDLNPEAFIIKKMDTNYIQNYLTHWKYDEVNRYLYYNISGEFYQTNRFKYYYYQIDYNNVTNISNTNILYKTFVSKRLNYTNFELKKSDSNDYVNITNKDKDFYFPLISGLNTLQKYRDPYNKTYSKTELTLYNDESTIKFSYNLAINDILTLNYLERDVNDTFENKVNLGNSIYYYFNKDNIINGSSLAVSPKLFAFYIPVQGDYKITILYSDEKQKNYKKENLTNCVNTTNILEQECFVNFTQIKNNTAQTIILNITNDTSRFTENIDFAYYHLDDNSKKCQTMNRSNMNNITLLVSIPNPNLKDKIKLFSQDTDIIDEKRENNEIKFILNGNNINLQRTYLQLFTDDGELEHWFTLQDLGINILPQYKIRFNNNKNITYLLYEDNQFVKVTISTENNGNLDLNDISGFKIKGENNKNLAYNVGNETINGEQNALNLIFNLSSVDKSEKNYTLYYTDRCGIDFPTDLKVSFVKFNFKRKYFVLNNNKDMKYQILIIEGPVEDDKISISVYRNGEYNGEAINNGSNYFLNFSQTSQRSIGDYTFRVINDGKDSPINETIVYVRENYEEILRLKEDISDCMFSNANKSVIKDFSYTITPSGINTNFRDFQSYFSSDQNNFINLTFRDDGKDKIFYINYDNEMKSNINLGNKLYIYLTESNDIDQPIYIFNYSYTNIELHESFTKFIYTDAEYIYFKMNCKINNMKNFELFRNGNPYSITCENKDFNDIFNDNIFKCYLSSDDNRNNKLLDFGKTLSQYDNFHIRYDQIQITSEPIFISQDIYTADFNVISPSQIDRNVNINIMVKTPSKIFYFPETERVTYYSTKESEKEIAFQYNNDNYISFNLFIENQTNYTINKICRKSCSYCRKDIGPNKEIDCQKLDAEPIYANTPEVNFKFDKHYIALQNSTNKNGDKDTISTVKITLDGATENYIQELIYYRHTSPTDRVGPMSINRQNGIFELKNLQKGKYTFQYRYNLYNLIYNIIDVVLVTTYDYEMFDLSDFSSKCIFYDTDLTIYGLLVSINPNPNYDFRNDIKIANLILELNGDELTFNGEKGYKINNNSLFSENNNFFKEIYFRESNLPDKNFVFTTFSNISTNTIYRSSLFPFYYKDNIIFKYQNCKSNNIYIKSISNPGEPFSLLQCNFSDTTQYCDAVNYKFSNINDSFYIYIGNKNLNTSFSINIYNSIKDSSFILNYYKQIINIKSSNFDMEKILQFTIDDKIITKFNYISSSNSISYEYVVNNGTESYVTELKRETHKLDRDTTIKIKKVNLKIESKNCNSHYMVDKPGENECVLCKERASYPGENKEEKWYQNGTCVSRCSNGFAIYDRSNLICLKCEEQTYENGNYVCGCLEGNVKSPVDGVCYLPESLIFKNLIIFIPSVQCYREDGKTHNYCKNETTSICKVEIVSGSAFPVCYCKDGYTGKYCEKKMNEIDLNNNIDDILNRTSNDKIDEGDIVVISKIRGIVHFIEKDKAYAEKINKNKIKSFLGASMNCIQEAINNEHNIPQIYDVIEITVYFLLFNINNSKRLRLLEEEAENRNNLKIILENAHYLNYLANSNYSDLHNIQSDKLNLLSFISYRTNAIDDSFKKYIKNLTYSSNIIGYANFNSQISDNNANDMVIITIFNRTLRYLDSLEDGLTVNLSFSNNDNLRKFENFYVYIYSPYININFELANYYQAKNINIYDKYDPCFTDRCFTSENFDFDLTQKYRKKKVFQKWSLDSEICRYNSFETLSNNIEILCKKFEDFGIMEGSINYATLDLVGKKDYVDNQDKVYNLPMRCKKKMNSENYAFWIFLIICILEIMYIIGITILTLGSLRRISIRKGLINDGFFYIIPQIYNTNDDITSNHDNPLNKKNDEIIKSTIEIDEKPKERIYNKTLLVSILSNFKELHPISVLCRVSIISPLIMNSWFLVFNILCLFGFNALIYYEGLIEKRIYDKKRNYFDYPMRKEFHKIILSILLQIALTVIIKAIVLVTLKQYENLESKFRKCKMKDGEINNDIIVRHDDFQDEMFIRRLLGGFLMTIIIIFFFYYSVVFCEVYLNTQRNLVFSWVWSLFWEWVIFAPIYIVVISVLERKKASSTDPLVYHLKRFFFF